MDVIFMGYSQKVQDGIVHKNKYKIQSRNNYIQVIYYIIFIDLPMIQLLPQADRKVP